jgi:hypothetical protein
VTYIPEKERETRLVSISDVLVCGAGPAGLAASISAARHGADTVLIENQGCLGGIWTAGLLSYVLDVGNKGGFLRELVQDLENAEGKKKESDIHSTSPMNNLEWTKGSFIYDAEIMKHILEEKCGSAGVKIRLHTRIVDAVIDHNQKNIDAVITESKSGREAWQAKVYIDATGDGDLGARAGCTCNIGHPEQHIPQPLTLIAILHGPNKEEIEEFMSLRAADYMSAEKKLYNAIERGGFVPSLVNPQIFHISDEFYSIFCNHIYNVSAFDAAAISNGTIRARHEIHEIVRALRSQGKPWGNLRIVQTAPHIGIREGRRILGRYMLTAEDILKGRKFKDGVCTVTMPVDIHSLESGEDHGYGDGGIGSKPYEIPMRSMIAKELNGLMMAGRCISGDFYAHASYRVSGNAAAIGEAVGRRAAEAVRRNAFPHEL